MQVVDLRRFLQEIGAFPALFIGNIIQKDCVKNLEIIQKNVDFDTLTISDAGRLKIVKQLLNCWKQKKKENWSKNLTKCQLPQVLNCGQDFCYTHTPSLFSWGGGG